MILLLQRGQTRFRRPALLLGGGTGTPQVPTQPGHLALLFVQGAAQLVDGYALGAGVARDLGNRLRLPSPLQLQLQVQLQVQVQLQLQVQLPSPSPSPKFPKSTLADVREGLAVKVGAPRGGPAPEGCSAPGAHPSEGAPGCLMSE